MKKIHLYLSFPFGIVLMLICFSGAMLVFEKEITHALYPERTQVSNPVGTPLSLDSLVARVSATLPDSVSIKSVAIPADASQAWQFNLSKPKKASVMVNPYTGELLPKSERLPFFSTMFRLHRWLLGPAKAADGGIGWGRLVVGTSTLVFVFVILSGLIVWWPRTRQVLRNSLKIPFHRGFRPFMRGAHVAIGVYVTLLLLAMSLTGLTWSFPWYRDGFYALFGDETQSTNTVNTKSLPNEKGKGTTTKSPQKQQGANTGNTFAWQVALENVQALRPEYQSITLSPGTAAVSTTTMGNARATDKYQLDQLSGAVLSVTKAEETPTSQKIGGWIMAVHTGSFGGYATRILWFLAALMGATLPISGYYLWWKRTHRRKAQ